MSNPDRTDLGLNSIEDLPWSHRDGIVSADRLIGRRVRVESEGGHRFEGYLCWVSLSERHVHLLDALELPGGVRHTEANISHVDWITTVSSEVRIQEVDLADISPGSYAVDELEIEGIAPYIIHSGTRGGHRDIPVVAPIQEEMVIVAGHKQLWAACQAGISSSQVIVEELSPDEYARRFANYHFPHPFDLKEERPSECYTDSELRVSIEKYFEEMGEDSLDIFPVQFNVDRLGMDENTGRDCCQ